ncbi:MPN311 family protein [Mycoplasmoides pneumoniae]
MTNDYQQLNYLVETDDEADIIIANLVKQLNELKEILLSLDNQDLEINQVNHRTTVHNTSSNTSNNSTSNNIADCNYNSNFFHNFSKETLQTQAKRGFLLLERCSLVGLQQLELEYLNVLGRSFESHQDKINFLVNLRDLTNDHLLDTEKIVSTLEQIFNVIGGTEYTPILNSFFNQSLNDPDPIQREIGLKQFVANLRQRFKTLLQKTNNSIQQLEAEIQIPTTHIKSDEVMFGPPDMNERLVLNDSETDAILRSIEAELESALQNKKQVVVTAVPPIAANLATDSISQETLEHNLNNTETVNTTTVTVTSASETQVRKPQISLRPIFQGNFPKRLSREDIQRYAHQLQELEQSNEG